MRRRILAAALAAVIGLTACGNSNSEPSAMTVADDPVSGGSLVVGLAAGIGGWTPADNQWTPGALTLARAVYDPLFAFTVEGEVEPYLAAGIASNEGFTEWTISLRDDVSFHNGDPLTAAAVVANLEALRLSPLLGSSVGRIDSVETIGESDVVVRLNEPWATFPTMLAVQAGFVVHPDLLSGALTDPVGTGPFVFESWVRGDRVEVTANPDYWREGLPHLERVTFEIITDDGSRKQALRAGNIDLMHTPEPAELIELAELGSLEDPELRAVRSEGANDVLFALLNAQTGPTADPEVRRALQLAIDRDLMNEQLFDGAFTVVDGPYAPTSRWWADSGWPAPDPAAAAALVAEWEGQHGPLELRLSTLPIAHLLETAQYLEATWDAIGVDVTIETGDESVYVLQIVTGDYQAAVLALFNAPDPGPDVQFLDPDNVGEPGGFGLALSRLESDTIAANLDTARGTDDFEERHAAYAEVWAELADAATFLWMVEQPWIFEAHDRVQGLTTFSFPDSDAEPLIVNWGSVSLTEAWLAD